MACPGRAAAPPAHSLHSRSSGGAVCAGMLAVMTRRKVPHVRGNHQALLDDRRPRGNPLMGLGG